MNRAFKVSKIPILQEVERLVSRYVCPSAKLEGRRILTILLGLTFKEILPSSSQRPFRTEI